MTPKNRTLLIVISAIVLVGALAGIAVLLSDDEPGEPVAAEPDGPVATLPDDVQENQPVEVVGDPLPSFDRNIDDPAIGTPVPVVNGQSFDGTEVSIGGNDGRPSLLVFLAHWCPHCNDEIPELIELKNRNGIPEELDVIGISTGVDSNGPNYPPSQWLLDRGFEWPVLADDESATAFLANGGSGFPYLMLVDADGNMVSRDSGTKSAEDLAAWIQEELGTSA